MSDTLTVIDPNGTPHEMPPQNAHDVVQHAGWSFAGSRPGASLSIVQNAGNPEFVVVISADGSKIEDQSFPDAADLIKAGWRRATDEEAAAFRKNGTIAPAHVNTSKKDGETFDPHKDLPVSHPDLVVFASANNLELKDGLTGEDLRADLLKQWDALKSAASGDDVLPEGSDRNLLKAFAEKHDLKLTVVGKSNEWIRNDLIEQFKAKQKA